MVIFTIWGGGYWVARWLHVSATFYQGWKSAAFFAGVGVYSLFVARNNKVKEHRWHDNHHKACQNCRNPKRLLKNIFSKGF